MSLEEYKKAAPPAMLRDAEACDVLKVTGMSAPQIPLHKLEDGGPGINTFEDLVTEYFYKVGPDVRRLADLVGGKEVDGTFAEGMCCFGVYVLPQPVTQRSTTRTMNWGRSWRV